MVTIKALEEALFSLLQDLRMAGFAPRKAILFGSYVKGYANDDSDIDIAVWADGFEGIRVLDIPKVASIISRYPSFELHPFARDEIAADNPFISQFSIE